MSETPEKLPGVLASMLRDSVGVVSTRFGKRRAGELRSVYGCVQLLGHLYKAGAVARSGIELCQTISQNATSRARRPIHFRAMRVMCQHVTIRFIAVAKLTVSSIPG